MTLLQLKALLPFLVLTLTSVVVMLQIAFARSHRVTAGLTILGFNLALLALIPAYTVTQSAPIELTSLLLVDGYAVLYMGVVLVGSLGVLTLCHSYFEGYDGNREELYLLLTVAALGGLTMVAARHMAGFFIGLELMSVPLYAMVAYPVKDRRATEGGMKYLILSAGASAFLLFGMALLYAETGDLSFNGMGARLAQGRAEILLAGGMMMVVGLAFKLSMVPFHLWTPDVYEASPAPVAAFLATVSKAATFAVAYRMFANMTLFKAPELQQGLLLLAISSIVLGNVLALFQDNVKRMLAYSSVAQFGYLLTALIIAGDNHGTTAAGIFLLTYIVTSLGVFGVMALVSSPMGDRDLEHIEQYRGLFWKRPYIASIMTAGLLSLAGIPATAGFIGKFYIIAAGVNASLWWLMGAVALGSAIGLFYYLRVMVMLFQPIPARERVTEPLSWLQNASGAMLMAAIVFTIVMGVYPEPFIQLVQSATLALR